MTTASLRTTMLTAALLLPASAAMASQGPGVGLGTASPFMQTMAAIVVYGSGLLIAGVGIYKAARRSK